MRIEGNSLSLSQYIQQPASTIENRDPGRIQDGDSFSFSEEAYQALENQGSAFTVTETLEAGGDPPGDPVNDNP
ncbi:hypothetical protein SCOR_10040 [Sulfidibacter corallicola]|uniref:Uncharacterized protein n=1 Tax=Sulfidibacter corallicola TaxID=2818388 RepID=A0A8A4TLS1_SULCO|nr:hypothetical protein [Sulfidibacter corallicola]QTD50906.1 hypothetical protein J3U87_00425 [Sulfidibacter corallicola]